ncbi:hypothetical protein ACTIVE_4707 [Actinomadura verrucosospora]|uniref:Uncharacterized protein n=1 Tax=Actinomadura verrucosospora TaxID=46165 RepID=A0A7D3ZYE4_ACTVE|nr:hypothetical protein ACTIVE_4707 [Actinomadura verrucosospora]
MSAAIFGTFARGRAPLLRGVAEATADALGRRPPDAVVR